MNKRFSTLLATALVASGMSAFAQQPDGELIYSTFNKVKDGERMQLASAQGGKPSATSKIFVVGADKGHQVLKPFDLVGRGDGDLAQSKIDSTSYAGLDSTLWTVTVKLSGTSRSYSFTNSKGAKLTVPTVTNAKSVNGGKEGGKIAGDDLTLVSRGISEWNYSDDKQCLYAFNNDSVFYLGTSNDKVELYSVKGDSEDAISGGNLFVARYPQASLTLDAKSFNQMLAKSHGKLFFHQSDVKGAPVTNNAGDNILTAKTWKAYQANVASENVEDSIPANGQKSWGKGGKGLGMLFPHLANPDQADSLLVLWSTGDNKALVVDTAYLAGTVSKDTNMVIGNNKIIMPAWKLGLADNKQITEKGKVNRPIGSVAFVVKINVATDSISIRPYNLPKYKEADHAFSDSLITNFTMQEGATKMVAGDFTVPTPALRKLGNPASSGVVLVKVGSEVVKTVVD
ncbi:hypothetical protein [Parabacteroides bouchesdurhonensis]|uniref:hypothetical protein n=1 Tax=Parabacteroides bouchesdurhonensis TaxID=1936995 RepID=UPI000C819CD0|nr:hypothetical protein [Parabacteroides bouchesdurhonensis]